jgi:hypothetical protein
MHFSSTVVVGLCVCFKWQWCFVHVCGNTKVTYVEDLLCSHCNSICYNQPLGLWVYLFYGLGIWESAFLRHVDDSFSDLCCKAYMWPHFIPWQNIEHHILLLESKVASWFSQICDYILTFGVLCDSWVSQKL